MQPQGRYTILGEIASGSTATVFLAEDGVLRRKVALKKLHPHLLNKPEMVRRFQKEAVAVASLSHENVIKIFDYGQEEKSVFLAMEFVDGASLECLLERTHGIIPNLAALSLFHQLFAGLAAAHAHGICHRDVKPSNVLIDRKGTVRLADFGIAFLSEETSLTRTGFYLGTPGYSSPEQAEGKGVTEKSDIFSAGILLYRCLTGTMPFAAGSPHAVLKAIVERNPARASLVNPRILPGMADLAQEMLAKHPEQRPDAKTCALRLEAISEGTGLPIEAQRLRCLLDDPAPAAEKEFRDIAERFARQARLMDQSGKGREALKLYSMVQVFSDKKSEAGGEARGYLKNGVRRNRVLATSWAVLACGVFAFWALRHPRSETEPGALLKPAPGVLPSPAATAPVPDFALPTEVPAWPKEAQGNSPVTLAKAASPTRRSVRPLLAADSRGAGAPASPFIMAPSFPEPASPSASEKGNEKGGHAGGYVWVKTTPPFARLRIDGLESGATPLDTPLCVAGGSHRLHVQHEGCKPVDRDFQVPEGDTVTLRLSLDRIEDVP
ncbi:MAG: protein kinase, partial [Fibrobacteres bacterium]|nr:protein kinase [Fibrobacterota bacterium]